LTLEQMKAEMAGRARLFRQLVDRFGDDVLEIVSLHTIGTTRTRLRQANLARRDLEAVMELLWDRMVEGAHFEVLVRTPHFLALRVTRCPFAEEMRRLGAADIGDAFYCAYDHGFCQGLNPAIRFTRTRTLMRGDDCCDHTYELPAVQG